MLWVDESVCDLVDSFDSGSYLWRKRERLVCRERGWTVVMVSVSHPFFPCVASNWFQNNRYKFFVLYGCF